MKVLKYILSAFLIMAVATSCIQDQLGDAAFVRTAVTPSNINAVFDVTQDNTGTVTITPNADGAISFKVYYGDGTTDPANLKPGESVTHIYPEGNYNVKVVAVGVNGATANKEIPLVVSFKAPENLQVTIENDQAVSKQVNVTVNADFAISYDVYFGEPGNDNPVSVNIGETASYVYQNAGTYTIRIVVKGAAIQTTEYTQDFEATAILQPVSSAPVPPVRLDTDVISIFSGSYTDVAGTDYFPDWGQGGQGSSWAMFNLNGDDMLQYINLSYQGIQFGSPVDATNMETLHLDIWTADVNGIDIYPIDGNGATEKFVHKDLVADQWNSIDIPLTDFTDQGLPINDIIQFKFVGDPWAGGTVFIDNIYFYKQPSGVMTSMIEDFEGTPPTFTEFGNIAPVQVVANPDMNGNTTSTVAQLTKTAGAEVWAGAFFEVGTPLDFNSYSKISMQVWSPKAGAVVKMKLENADSSITTEIDQVTTTSNGWEKLTYDFSAAPVADYVRIVVFFDFGNAGDDAVYYFDEIQLESAGGPQPLVFQDFEGAAPTFTVFGNIDMVQVIANPDNVGNSSANVVQMKKNAGSEVWAGSFFEVSSPLDFNNYSKISVKTWSPKVGAVVKVKLENADSSVTTEVDQLTTVGNSWETLTYDFSAAPVADYVRVVIFFDFGNAGDDSLYYYDDFTLTN
ncbi:MAG: PKD domain-containing protein [Lutibacter sp.]